MFVRRHLTVESAIRNERHHPQLPSGAPEAKLEEEVHHPLVVVADLRHHLNVSVRGDAECELDEGSAETGPLKVVGHGDRDLEAAGPVRARDEPAVGDDRLMGPDGPEQGAIRPSARGLANVNLTP